MHLEFFFLDTDGATLRFLNLLSLHTNKIYLDPIWRFVLSEKEGDVLCIMITKNYVLYFIEKLLLNKMQVGPTLAEIKALVFT